MTPYDELQQNISLIEKIIGYTFSDKEILLSAFIHSSFLNEYKALPVKHNERLEFLGDSVLNLLIAEFLFRNFPERPEGDLSSLRSSIVSAQSCTEFIQSLGIENFLLVGRGEQLSGRLRKTSILADLFEALLGAIYLDGGFDQVRHFFFTHLSSSLDSMLQKPQLNFKAELQELVQKTRKLIPQYEVIEETGPDHQKQFKIGVFIEETLIGSGIGTSKKEAEQLAAKEALNHLRTI